MKLIVETAEHIGYITEAKEDGSKNLYIEGVFLQSAIKNRNGRIYPEEVMDREVERYIKESVETNRAIGELNHPPTPALDLERVSHKIVSLKKEGTNYVGKALITKTPMGDIARGLIESGVNIGVSSRGMGTLKLNKQGINEVQSDFKLVTAADLVSNPSAPDAYVTGIMENVSWFYDESLGNWRAAQIAEEAKQIIKKMTTEQIQENKFHLWESHMRKIASISKI